MFSKTVTDQYKKMSHMSKNNISAIIERNYVYTIHVYIDANTY